MRSAASSHLEIIFLLRRDWTNSCLLNKHLNDHTVQSTGRSNETDMALGSPSGSSARCMKS